jgi:hypothetical protein
LGVDAAGQLLAYHEKPKNAKKPNIKPRNSHSHNSCDKIRKKIMDEKQIEMLNIILKLNGLILAVIRHVSSVI